MPQGQPPSMLRRPDWLTGERARAALLVWLILQIAAAAYMAYAFHGQSAADGGKPVATDFMTFWSAARMAWLAGPPAAYDDAARSALQHQVGSFGGPGGHYAYWYPPPFLLLSLPLGLVGYVPALCGFLAAGYAVLLFCLRRILPDGAGVLALIASPVMLLNTVIGQNGAWTAACFAGALLLLARAPLAAGACLGVLVCKPHLALLVPMVLAAAGRWRALAACAAMAASLCGLSWGALGTPVWRLFLAHAAEARMTLEQYADDWTKIQSVFSAVRLLHGSIRLAYGCQAVSALLAAWVVWRVARTRPDAGGQVAVLTIGALIVTPYMFDYDLVCLLVPMAWLGAAALRDGWRPWEKIVLLLAYAVPLLARIVAGEAAIPLVPLPLWAMLVVCARRAMGAS